MTEPAAKHPPRSRFSSSTTWASRLLSGPIVESNISTTVDDRTVLTKLPPAHPGASGLHLPDQFGLNMCSVNSTDVCASTTWCQTTTACPSTTNCPSKQTCMAQETLDMAGRPRLPIEADRIWPIAIS
jgi:hypothetical protein